MKKNFPPIRRHDQKGDANPCLITCLVVAIVGVVVVAILGVLIAFQGAKWLTDGFEAMSITLVDGSSLSVEEKEQTQKVIEANFEDFRGSDGKVTWDDWKPVFERFQGMMLGEPNAALRLMILASSYEIKLDASGLSDEEKQAFAFEMQRLYHGVDTGMVPAEKANSALDNVFNNADNEFYNLKETTSDEDLRQLTQEAKEVSDEAGVPNEMFEVDLSDRYDRFFKFLLLGEGDAPGGSDSEEEEQETESGAEDPVLPE